MHIFSSVHRQQPKAFSEQTLTCRSASLVATPQIELFTQKRMHDKKFITHFVKIFGVFQIKISLKLAWGNG